MKQERDEMIKSLFLRASEMPESEQSAYLGEACSDDAVRREVEALLSHDAAATNEDFRSPVEEAARQRSDLSSIAPTEDPLPKTIGRFRVIRRLGEGGMGVVYKATQELPKRTVALKVIRPHVVNERTLERFKFEAQVLGKLQHPGIASIYEAGVADLGMGDQPYFAMELVRGLPLREHATKHSLNLRQRLELVSKIAEAVHHAHTRGVVHRDLKPANILVTEEGQPKILDFGVARTTQDDPRSTAAQTQFGQLVGTVPYMSPEQVQGDPEDLDARSDVYSLGVVLFELIAGTMPYDLEKKMVAEAARVICEVEPTRLSVLSRSTRGDVETICQKALEKDRIRRYQSASELATDISRYLRDEPIIARPPSAAYQVQKFAKRHSGVFGAAVAAVLALAGGLGVALVQLDRATKAERVAEEALAAETAARVDADRRAAELRSLAESFVSFEEEIDRLEGATAARALLARSAVASLDALADQASGDGGLRELVGRARLRVGQISLKDASSAASAEAAFAEAREVFDEGSADWVVATAGLSTARVLLGRSSEALISSREAVDAARELFARADSADSGDAAIDPRVGRGWLSRAEVLIFSGRAQEALAVAIELGGFVYAGIDRWSDEVKGEDLEADAAFIHAAALAALGRDDEAEPRYERAISIRRSQVAGRPRDALAKKQLVDALQRRAKVAERLGRIDEAIELHRETLAVSQRLVDADPADLSALDALLTSHEQLSTTFRASGKYEEALRSAELYRDAAQRACERAPENLTRRRRLGLAHEFVARAARRMGDLDHATRQSEEAAAIFRWLRESDPSTPVYGNDLGRVLIELSQARFATKDVDGAIESLEQAASVLGTLAAGGLVNAETLPKYARGVRNLAILYMTRERFGEALERFEQADEIEAKEDGRILTYRADCHAGVGEITEAVVLMERAVEWYERAGQATRLADAREKLGDLQARASARADQGVSGR